MKGDSSDIFPFPPPGLTKRGTRTTERSQKTPTKGPSSSSEDKDSRRLHDVDADRSVLGSILLKPELMPLVAASLRPFGKSAFYQPTHQVVWSAALAVYDTGSPPDPVLVAGQMPSHGWTRPEPPIMALGQLTDFVKSTANIEHYLAVTMRSAALREAVSAAESYTRGANLNGPSTLKQIGELINRLNVAQRNAQAAKMASEKLAESKEAFLKMVREVMGGEVILRDIMTGIRSVDNLVGGFGRGDLSIIAARPGVGKTTLACNIAINEAERGKSVLLYSFEMSKQELMLRLGAIQGRYDMGIIGPGGDEAAYRKVASAIEELSAMPIYLVESMKPVAEIMEQSLREHSAAHGNPDILIVDYLQLMRSVQKTDNRNQEIGLISRMLKELAREFNCVVIALSQFRRLQTQQPQLDDLKDSGSIEQDADSVLFLHYKSHEDPSRIVLNVDVAKNRHGETGTTQVMFLRGKQVIKDL